MGLLVVVEEGCCIDFAIGGVFLGGEGAVCVVWWWWVVGHGGMTCLLGREDIMHVLGVPCEKVLWWMFWGRFGDTVILLYTYRW